MSVLLRPPFTARRRFAMESADLTVTGDAFSDPPGTVSASALRFQQPVAGLLTATQGWVAMRFDGEVASADLASANYHYWEWGVNTEASNELLLLDYVQSGGVFRMRRGTTAGGVTSVNVSGTWAESSSNTVVGAWEAARIRSAFNGSTFTNNAQSAVPDLSAATLADLFSRKGAARWTLERMRWAVTGEGVLTDADSARLHSIGPNLSGIDRILSAVDADRALPTSWWNARTARFERIAA